MQKALIYCRVSSDRQVKEGHGLETQEKRCRDYAERKGYTVDQVFKDEGVSGGLLERPAMQKLLQLLEKNFFNNYIILIDDITRLARDIGVHTQLRVRLKAWDAKLESPNFEFNDTAENKLQENITAVFAQYERDKNRRQVLQKMKARLEMGYWTFGPPPGLINTNSPIHGKILIPYEPLASIYKEAIESFANNILITKQEVKTFILEEYKRHNIKRKLSINGTEKILRPCLKTSC